VVVDSSKLPAWAHLLARSGLVDLRVVHLVRDSRAYAYAAQKTIPRPEVPGEYMPRPGVVRCSLEWLGFHLLAGALRGCSSRYVRLSYEEFAGDPAGALDRVMWVFDRTDKDGIVELDGATATLDLQRWHAVSGNPLRFVEGRVPVRLDDDWRRGLPARSRWLVTVLTAPGLLYYGYLRRSGARATGRRNRGRPRSGRGPGAVRLTSWLMTEVGQLGMLLRHEPFDAPGRHSPAVGPRAGPRVVGDRCRSPEGRRRRGGGR
jgi:hypothetical protein